MKSITPVVPGLEPFEIHFGGESVKQPEYETLIALRSSKETGYKVMSRWQLTDEERALIAAGADLYMTQLTFGHEFQPIMPVIQLSSECERQKDWVVEVFELEKELDERLKNF